MLSFLVIPKVILMKVLADIFKVQVLAMIDRTNCTEEQRYSLLCQDPIHFCSIFLFFMFCVVLV